MNKLNLLIISFVLVAVVDSCPRYWRLCASLVGGPYMPRKNETNKHVEKRDIKKRIAIYGEGDVSKYVDLFSQNGRYDVSVVTEFSNDFDGFVFPGGNSNVTNKETPYWKFVNQSIESKKPVFGICLGFQHLVKKLYPEIKMSRCYMYNILLDLKKHNHKWCVSSDYAQLLSDQFVINYFTFENKEYIGSLTGKNNSYFATIFHPEKQSILTQEEKSILNSYFKSIEK